MPLLGFLAWALPPTFLAGATLGLRRRHGAEDSSDGLDLGLPQQESRTTSARGVKLATATVLAGLVMLLLWGAASKRDSWGNRWVLQRSCKPPSPAGRLSAWGELHNNFTHTILTTSPEAQALFNQGLLLAWDFSRAETSTESLNSFQACLAYDPAAAMCHWGVAYAVGPFLNVVDGLEEEGFPVFGPRQAQQAHQAAERALQLAQQALEQNPSSPLAQRELHYCQAAAARFAAGTRTGAARLAAERAYAEAMEAYPRSGEDATALALAAEAWMNMVPWDFVDAGGGLRPEAAAAEALLRRALRLHPTNELALHLLVHMSEVAHHDPAAGPSEGEQAADRLSGLQPRMGHLQHMPSHLYIRVGRYHDAVRVNTEAYAADTAAASHCLQSYLPEHNLQMLMFAASMGGEYAALEEWGAKMWGLPEAVPRSAWPGRERTMLLLAQVRFAMWDKVLVTPPPASFERGPGDPGGHIFARAAWRFARCLALAATAQRAQQAQNGPAAQRSRQSAEQELQQLREEVGRLPPDLRTRPGQGVGIYSPGYNDLGAIAIQTAEARLLALDGRWEEAAAALQAAAAAEAATGYVEPPRLLHQPLLQCAGWALLHMGRYEEAAEAYRADLAHHRGNAWSLLGLAQALMRSGRSAEAAEARAGFERAWRHANQRITNSCPAFGG